MSNTTLWVKCRRTDKHDRHVWTRDRVIDGKLYTSPAWVCPGVKGFWGRLFR